MRTMQEAYEAVETYSPAEEHFNRRRRTAGLIAGPLIFLAILAWPMPIPGPAHRMAAIMALVVVSWVSEALPMAVTALLGPVLAVILQVAPASTALAAFGDPIIFLFIGSFMLAEAMFVHGVDRRIAYTALAWRGIGTSGTGVLIVFGVVTTALSMWMSNTATTAMMFPIALSIVARLARAQRGSGVVGRRFAMAMMLMTSFGASVGGLATPVGTPPNLIGIGLIDRIEHVRIDFGHWMLVGVPLVLVLFACLCAIFWLTCSRGFNVGEDNAVLVREELAKLGPMSVGQRNTLVAFGVTVLLWIAPGVFALTGSIAHGLGDTAAHGYFASMPEGIAAMVGAMLLFLLPVDWRSRRFTLTWEEAARIDWGTVLLYGGGLALGQLVFSTGLAKATGDALVHWLPTHSTLALTVIFTGVSILLSEVTSNTASANMIVPLALAVGDAAGVDALLPALGATFGASMGFMMPISTAPNAIVYSSGFVPIAEMMKFGVLVDLIAFVAIVVFVMTIGALLF